MQEKRAVHVDITPTQRGVKVTTRMHIDGRCVKTITAQHFWRNGQTSKAPDEALYRALAGACVTAMQNWMNQPELPF